MNPEQPAYVPLVKTLSFALKQLRLYSESHPLVKQTLAQLARDLDRYFADHAKLNLGAMQNKLLVDGVIVSDKELASADLAKDMQRLGVEGLVIDKGLTIFELTSFMNLFAMRPKSLEEKGGFKLAFENAGFAHIRLSAGKFALVEEGEVVAASGDVSPEGSKDAGPVYEVKVEPDESFNLFSSIGAGGAGGDVKPIASISDVIQQIRQGAFDGQINEQNVVLDAEKIVHQIEKNPEQIVEVTLAGEEDESRLELMIRKFVKVIVEGLVSFLVKHGKDISKALSKLAKELERALGALGEGEEIQRLRRKIPEIFEEGTDELRIRMMTKAYRDSPGDLKALEKIAAKLFKEKEIRDRLSHPLMEELETCGMPREATAGMLSKIEIKEDNRKKKTTISAEELEALKKKAELYDAMADHKLAKTVQKLEIENKIIRHQKERVDAVIRNLAEGLVVVDEEGKVVLMNPAAEKLLGVRQAQKIGRSVTESLKEEHVVSLASGKLKDSAEPGPQQVDLLSANEETKRVIKASTAVVENEDGQTVGMVSILSDITKQKELDDMKDKFVANVSHELRTPLVAIQKSLALILGREVGEVTAEQERFLDIAQRNIGRLSRLINDLLDVSKLEAGKMALKKSRFLLKGLVFHVLSTVETWARDKHIELKTEFSDEGVEVEADSDRMTQVLTNLVSNAIKFTPESGTVTVRVSGYFEDPSLGRGRSIEVAVEDTGVGISPEDKDQIFNKFVQVGNQQNSGGMPSTGLGLTITREIIQLHSGKIWAESEGNGSRFIFRIPAEFSLNEQRYL